MEDSVLLDGGSSGDSDLRRRSSSVARRLAVFERCFRSSFRSWSRQDAVSHPFQTGRLSGPIWASRRITRLGWVGSVDSGARNRRFDSCRAHHQLTTGLTLLYRKVGRFAFAAISATFAVATSVEPRRLMSAARIESESEFW